jgi:Mn-dependent DtxR family transcriptional regulator
VGDKLGVAVEILELLEQRPRLNVELISRRVPVSRRYVKDALTHLVGLGLIVRISRGMYELSPLGRKLLEQLRSEANVRR